MIYNKFKIFTDERGGNLIPIEFKNLPFSPQRIFSVSNVPINNIRGNHSHFKTHQFLICVFGKILVGLDDGFTKKEIILSEGDSVLIENLVWDYQQFLTGNDYMMVLCSTEYDIKDYIFDYNEFLKIKSIN